MPAFEAAPQRKEARNGKFVLSPYSDNEAFDLLERLTESGDIKSNFAVDLREKGRRYGLSAAQEIWVHIIVVEYMDRQKKAESAPKIECPQIRAMADGIVAKGGKRMKIKCEIDGQMICLSLAGPNSKNAGCIYVTNGGSYGSPDNRYYGKIDKEGVLQLSGQGEAMVERIQKFEADPVAVAKAHGALTGHCCFCSQSLKTKESVGMGYGPHCAKKYDLPWGSTEEYDKMKEDIVA